MMRRGGRVVGVVLVGLAVIGIASGCGGSDDGADRLGPALDELASVGGPDGQAAADLEVVGCDDDAEMPAGYASYERGGSVANDAAAVNAGLAEVAQWYLPRWEELGWDVDEATGSATKEVDGVQLDASIDVGPPAGYAIVVAQHQGGLCG
jgi:hypothetical protein